MKILLRTLVIAAGVMGLLLMPATTLAQPVMPILYQGSVTIDEADAPIDTIITAEIDGDEIATNAPGTTIVGTYTLDIVADEGDVVVLKVNDVVAGESTYPDRMTTPVVILDLSVGEAPPITLTVEAGGPYSGAVGESISLSGSASGGTEPYIYAWDLDEDGQYDDATGASPTYSWATAGSHTIGLQVTDDVAATATDTAMVVVSEEGADPWDYDQDEDDVISKDEALNAVADYGTGTISKAYALAVVKLYFS